MGVGHIFDNNTLDLLQFISEVTGIKGDILTDRFLKTVLHSQGGTTVDRNKYEPIKQLFDTHRTHLINLYEQLDDADINGDINRKQQLFHDINIYKETIRRHVESQLLK